MVPETLETWTIDAIRNVVAHEVFESRVFDFKEGLPVSADERGKARLRKTLAAFANSSGGGFLIIGVKDDRGLDADARVVGVDATVDVPEHLKALGSACIPRVQVTTRAPPHRLVSGRLVHVIQVHEGSTKPHGVFESDRWTFPKRTDGGNDLLSYEEIRDAFRDQRAVRAALMSAKREVDQMARHAEDLNRQSYSRVSREDLALLFRPALLESALLQVLGHLDWSDVMMEQLAVLRGAATAADVEATRLVSQGGSLDLFGRLVYRVLTSARLVSSAIDRTLQAGAPSP
jgi:hypothetical protein